MHMRIPEFLVITLYNHSSVSKGGRSALLVPSPIVSSVVPPYFQTANSGPLLPIAPHYACL